MRIFVIFRLLIDFIKYRTFDLQKIIDARSQEVRDLKAELEAKVGKLEEGDDEEYDDEDEDDSDDEILPIRPNQSLLMSKNKLT